MGRLSFEEILNQKIQQKEVKFKLTSDEFDAIPGLHALFSSVNSVCFKSQSSNLSKYRQHILPEDEAFEEVLCPLSLAELHVNADIRTDLKVFIDLGAEFYNSHVLLSEIKIQFKRLALKWHPDKHFRESDENLGEYNFKFMLLMSAYNKMKVHSSFIISQTENSKRAA